MKRYMSPNHHKSCDMHLENFPSTSVYATFELGFDPEPPMVAETTPGYEEEEAIELYLDRNPQLTSHK